ncbi:MAG: RDD family protein [Chloroflexi bacterium]|nr:RDD family protein [Chloroflexota bacterium]MDA1145595.1 RDD family protein [Chloroflexota bacterium]
MDFAGLQLLGFAFVILGGLTGLIWGLTTSGSHFPTAHLDQQFGITTATPARRLTASVLEVALFVCTFAIGWVIWFLIVAPRGQTPAKVLLSTYVMREDGSRAGGWYMWGREALVKWLLFSFLNTFTFGVASTLAALWCLWDDDKQCGWDKVMSSYVAYSPHDPPSRRTDIAADPGPGATAGPPTIAETRPSDRLRELQQLRADGIITAEEYEERRQRLIDQP